MVTIFVFKNSRDFLRAYINSLPKNGWGELQRWADHLGVQAPYISQALSGSKTLNIDQTLKLASHLGLKGLETDYLINLMEKERAGSHETKKYFDVKLESIKKQSEDLSRRIPKDQVFSEVEKSIFYSSWHYSAIRIFCSLYGKGKSLEQITERFNLKRSDAIQILDFLCDAELCVKKNNLYVPGSQQTHLENSSPHIHRHRQNWRVKTLSQIETTQAEELVFSAPFSISQTDFEILREELALFLENFFKRIRKTDPEEMAILNIDLMKLR